MDIFAALAPFGISREAAEFGWFQFHQAREDVQVTFWEDQDGDDHAAQIPRTLLFEPQQVKDSLSLLLRTAQQNGLTKTQSFYCFEVHRPDGTVFNHDCLHVATNLQIWRLEAGLEFCIATSHTNAAGEYLSRPLRVNWLLNHVVGDELTKGYVYVEDGISPFITRTQAEAKALATTEDLPPEHIYLAVETQPDAITVHLKMLMDVCDFALANGYLIDVQHSY